MFTIKPSKEIPIHFFSSLPSFWLVFVNYSRQNDCISDNLLIFAEYLTVMNFIKSLFKSGTNRDSNNLKSAFPWKKLEDSNQLDEIVEISQEKPVVIFKHSTRCGVSRAVLKAFEKQTENLDEISFYHLDLLKYRDISDDIAEKFELAHQSPQLLFIKKGKLVAADSHYSLLQIAIK